MLPLVLSLNLEFISLHFVSRIAALSFFLDLYKKSLSKNQFLLQLCCCGMVCCNKQVVCSPAEKKNRSGSGLGRQLMGECNEATQVCFFSGESLCGKTVIYIFQTMFQMMFHSILSRLVFFIANAYGLQEA